MIKMRGVSTGNKALSPLVAALSVALLSFSAHAQIARSSQSFLDDLSFRKSELRAQAVVENLDDLRFRLAGEGRSELSSVMEASDRFRTENGMNWTVMVDKMTGRVNLLDGGAIPFIPGPANDLSWSGPESVACREASCVPLSKLEGLARDFLWKYQDLFQVNPGELILDPVGSVPVGSSIYFLCFQWVHGNVPVEGASVFFVINNGNLVQVSTEKIGDISLDPIPSISKDTAWDILHSYLGGEQTGDQVVEPGALLILPVAPRGADPDVPGAMLGKMMDYILAYRLVFRRPGIMGTWGALVDAHTGEILQFGDVNVYGHIQGGVYKTDAPFSEVNVPFPYANYGSGLYSNATGDFTGTTGTSTLTGTYVRVLSGKTLAEGCSSSSSSEISLSADASGLIDFGSSGGTDCTTPGFGGVGNTHAARTQYWNVTAIKQKALTYLPSNAWLQGQLTDYVNRSALCNAYWDGTALNFFKAQSPCGNTGEIPGVSLHEWGHGMDANDGSGSGTDNVPLETRADWTALLQTHISCAGAGFLTSNCSGYGNACTNCTGVREADYAKHVNPTPWTPQNKGTVWGTGTTCPSSCSQCYYGPCGWEDHCESGLATQALWDLVNRDLIASPTNMDLVSAWQLADRLFYTSMPQALNMYTCTGTTTKTSNGCGGGSIYTTFRAVDDDGDGTANGTPHAAAIFAALNRHGIACGASGDAANQNETSCPSLVTPLLSGAAGNSQNVLSWTTGGASATRYFVFRNEMSCDAGFTRIATVAAPTLTYTDSSCYNGVTYFYRIQAATSKDQCTSPMSNCVTLTPSPCTTPGTPVIGTVTAPANNQLSVPWTPGSPAGATYNVYRSTGACPGGTYSRIASGVASSPYLDTSVSGGTTYSYKVSAVDSTGGCESGQSGCASATATGVCTLPPTFAGLTSVTNPGNATCTLNLAWGAATSNCGGAISYNVYRSTSSPFTPSLANRIAAGIVGTAYTDTSALSNGTPYYYIVRAVDDANGVEETNSVMKGATPTGPTTTTSWTDTFEGSQSGGGFDLAGWSHNTINGTTNWQWSTARYHDGTHSWYAQDITSTSDMVLVSPAFGVGPATTMSFYHTYAFEGTVTQCYDGGTLEYSTDGGTTWSVMPDADFTAGGFTGTVNTGYSNPIGGKRAWCAGTVGTMTLVTLNLGSDSNLLNKSIRVRWHEGNDSSVAATGWYVDTVTINNAQSQGTCATGAVGPPGVPNGISGPAMTCTKTSADGSAVTLNWDASCAGAQYEIVYGTDANLPTTYAGTYGLAGVQCSIGSTGTYAWSSVPPVPPGSNFLWWLVVATDGAMTEGSWGKNTGQERNGPGSAGSSQGTPGACAATKNLANTCGQ